MGVGLRRPGPAPMPMIIYRASATLVDEARFHDATIRKRVVLSAGPSEQGPSVDEYYVDVPLGVYPGEPFYVAIGQNELLLVCPEIRVEGERIIVCINRRA